MKLAHWNEPTLPAVTWMSDCRTLPPALKLPTATPLTAPMTVTRLSVTLPATVQVPTLPTAVGVLRQLPALSVPTVAAGVNGSYAAAMDEPLTAPPTVSLPMPSLTLSVPTLSPPPIVSAARPVGAAPVPAKPTAMVETETPPVTVMLPAWFANSSSDWTAPADRL